MEVAPRTPDFSGGGVVPLSYALLKAAQKNVEHRQGRSGLIAYMISMRLCL